MGRLYMVRIHIDRTHSEDEPLIVPYLKEPFFYLVIILFFKFLSSSEGLKKVSTWHVNGTTLLKMFQR